MLQPEEKLFVEHCRDHTTRTVRDIVLAISLSRVSATTRFGGPLTAAEVIGDMEVLTTDVTAIVSRQPLKEKGT